MAEDTVAHGVVRVGVFYVRNKGLKHFLSVKQSNLTVTGSPFTPSSGQKTMKDYRQIEEPVRKATRSLELEEQKFLLWFTLCPSGPPG